METPLEKIKFYELKIRRAIKNFDKRGFISNYFVSSDEAVNYLMSNITKQHSIGYGGSRTLDQLGLIEKLRKESYKLIDRSNPNNTPEKKAELERECFSADIYLASANAVSEGGAVVNIDLYANRVSAISFGPKKVYLLVGRNKLCLSLEDALERARNSASVMNAVRFNRDTPCTKTGYCHDCDSPDRICGTTSVIERSGIKGRIHLLFINEDLGF